MNVANVLDIVRSLLDVILTLVPENVAASMLSDRAAKRQTAIAEAAEAAKFGPKR